MSKTKSFLKQKRAREYEQITKELTESGLNLSEIKIEDFVLSRLKETKNFQDILDSKINSKTGHQLLPKHMRRRQMSHNPFRIPRYARVSNLTVKVKSKLKKNKRKLINLRRSIIRRAKTQKWLETHLFHSKRFFMNKYYNTYTVPYKRRDKGYRACYKYWNYSSCIHDISYYEYCIIQLISDNSNKINIFINQYIFKYSSEPMSLIKYSILKMYFRNVYNSEGCIIGPLNFFIIDNMIIFMFNSGIRNELYQHIKNVSGDIQYINDIKFTNDLNTFILIGKQSIDKIYTILHSCIYNKDDIGCINNFKEYIDKCENGNMEIFKINIPKSQFKMNELVFNKVLSENTTIKENIIYNSKNSIYSNDLKNIYINCKNIDTISGDFNIGNDRTDIITNDIIERTKFMHRRNINLKKLNSKLEKSIINYKTIKRSNKSEKLLLQKKKNNIQADNKHNNILSDITQQTYITLIKHNIYTSKDKYESIYYIIFNKGFATDLLRRFSYINTKVIGIKELSLYYSQKNQYNFPQDYPDSKLYQYYIINRAKKKISKYYKKPAGKRVNYQKIYNPSPFYPNYYYIKSYKSVNSIFEAISNIKVIPGLKYLADISYLDNFNKINNLNSNTNKNQSIVLLKFNFETLNKGVPEYNDLICLPEDSDIEAYIHFKDNIKLKNILLKSNSKSDILKEKNIKGDINEIISQNKNFFIKENTQNQQLYCKNKDINVEILAILDYYKTGMTKQITNTIINKDFTINFKCTNIRKIIGYVSSGIYDYESCTGKGIGNILIDRYKDIYRLKKKYKLDFLPIFMRKKTSMINYLIKINDI